MHVDFVENYELGDLSKSVLDLILVKFVIRRDWIWWTDSIYTPEQFITFFYYSFDVVEFFKKLFSSVNYTVGNLLGSFFYENRELAGEYSVSLRGGGSFNFDLVTWAYLMSSGSYSGWLFFSMFLGIFGGLFTLLNKFSKLKGWLFLSTNLLYVVVILSCTYVDRDFENLVVFLMSFYILLVTTLIGFRR